MMFPQEVASSSAYKYQTYEYTLQDLYGFLNQSDQVDFGLFRNRDFIRHTGISVRFWGRGRTPVAKVTLNVREAPGVPQVTCLVACKANTSIVRLPPST